MRGESRKTAKHVTLCYTAMKRLRTEGREEKGGGQKQRRRKKTETEGKWRRWEKTMMEQKGRDLEAREQASE